MNRNICAFCLIILGGIATGRRAEAGPLNPTGYASLGTLSLTSGSYTIDSSPGSLILNAGGVSYTGVNVGGIAVFDFDSITIAGGAYLMGNQGIGHLPIALLSRSSAAINGRVDVSAFATQGGAGAVGVGTGSVGSAGRNPNDHTPGPSGYGASGGGGGGFGGVGGQGGSVPFLGTSSQLVGGVGGAAYGRLDARLQGGSAGASNYYLQQASIPGAGAGGGAIEFGAVQGITIGGAVSAIGGDALNGGGDGGGSGGGIYIHANSVSVSGYLDVRGGAGGFGSGSDRAGDGGGGGGGGGQIVIQAFTSYAVNLDHIILVGGQGGDGRNIPATAGAAGAPGQLNPSAVPEPSSLAMLGTSAFGLTGHALRRRAARRRPGP